LNFASFAGIICSDVKIDVLSRLAAPAILRRDLKVDVIGQIVKLWRRHQPAVKK
jgi:hypothetical protein